MRTYLAVIELPEASLCIIFVDPQIVIWKKTLGDQHVMRLARGQPPPRPGPRRAPVAGRRDPPSEGGSGENKRGLGEPIDQRNAQRAAHDESGRGRCPSRSGEKRCRKWANFLQGLTPRQPLLEQGEPYKGLGVPDLVRRHHAKRLGHTEEPNFYPFVLFGQRLPRFQLGGEKKVHPVKGKAGGGVKFH